MPAFAWSAATRDLAKLIGISNVALKKHLTKLGVVTPPRGHWNRIAAGKQGAAGCDRRVALAASSDGFVAQLGHSPTRR